MAEITPYVGITGFTKRGELTPLLDEIRFYPKRQLMVGVISGERELRDEERFTTRRPKVSEIAEIFLNDKRVLNLVHYNQQSSKLRDNLSKMTRWGGENLHGFQLNMKWPRLEDVEAHRASHPQHRIVLQIGYGAAQELDLDPVKIADRVKGYLNCVTDVLIDPSGGRGVDFTSPEVSTYALNLLYELINRYPLLQVGIAGGLYGGNLKHNVSELLKIYNRLSVDAEGKLRDSETDELILEECKSFIREANRIF